MSFFNSTLVSQSTLLSQDILTTLAHSPQGENILQTVFGDSFEEKTAIDWLKTETQNNFRNFPTIEIVSAQNINYAQGAYSGDTNTIYLAAEFVSQNSSNSISNVILEEYGHFLDAQFNSTDAPGDEGYLFAGMAQQRSFTPQQIADIRAESDIATVFIDDSPILIEQANPGDNPAFDLIGLTQLRNDPQFSTIDGSGFSVAVIDTGIDTDHPLIAPNYITGYDFVDDDDDPSDPERHGTHVAGTVGATDETIGVAPGVGLIGLRVLDSNGEVDSLYDVEEALEWVFDNREQYNITAVNLSLGGGFFTSEDSLPVNIISDDIQRLEDSGVTIVSSAGNDYFVNSGQPNQENLAFPAISSTLAVGAVYPEESGSDVEWENDSIDYTTGADRITSFSQRLDAPNMVFAPGAFITSTIPGGGTYPYGGTSQASPHVAGTVALIQQASLEFSGRLLTPEEVQEILFTTGDEIVDGDDEDGNIINTGNSYVRINVYNAISEVEARSDDVEAAPDNFSPIPRSQGNYNLSVSSGNDVVTGSTVYRFFRPDVGVHLYTASEFERDSIIANLPNYSYEGESYISAAETADPLTGTGTRPVHRFFNNDTGAHFYTISEAERDSISSSLPNYAYEGVAYYSYQSDLPDAAPLYRFYNPVIDAHFYTPSSEERDSILTNLTDYQLESDSGIAFYVEPVGNL